MHLSFHHIYVIARYTGLGVLRNRIFQISGGMILLLIACFHLRFQSHFWNSQASLHSLSSFIPYMNALLFNLMQVIPLVFICGSFLPNARKKYDTTEIIEARPESNTEYITGIFLGILTPFLLLNLLSLFIAALINILFSTVPFHSGFYLFYLITLNLPTLLFFTGLSFFLYLLLKHHFITQLIIFTLILSAILIVRETAYGLTDPFAISIPNTFSDITGHPGVGIYLIQRCCWMLMGIGLLLVSTTFLQRLAHRHETSRSILFIGSLPLFLSLSCGIIFYLNHAQKRHNRMIYRNAYIQHGTGKRVTVEKHDITFQQHHKTTRNESRMTLVNREKTNIREIILYLNPSLKIEEILCNGSPVTYVRDHQVITIRKDCSPGEEVELFIRYKGKINESICFLDIPDNLFFETKDHSFLGCIFGKRYAYLENAYTLLTPDCLWYPVATPLYAPGIRFFRDIDFTQFTLTVRNYGKRSVIAPGKAEENDDSIVFLPDHPLSGITLCMARYTDRTLKVDSVEYSLHLEKKHENLFAPLNVLKDTLPGLIRLNQILAESLWGCPYPYKRLQLIEAPLAFYSYYRPDRGNSGRVQAEMVLIPENGVGINPAVHSGNRKIGRNSELTREEAIPYFNAYCFPFTYEYMRKTDISGKRFNYYSLLADLLEKEPGFFSPNPFKLNSLFVDDYTCLYDTSYPLINTVLNRLFEKSRQAETMEASRDELYQKAINYLQQNSFKDAIGDPEIEQQMLNYIFEIKSTDLRKRLTVSGIPKKSFITFLEEWREKHQFQRIGLQMFVEDFYKKFNLQIEDILEEWYTCDRAPSFLIKELISYKIPEEYPDNTFLWNEIEIFNAGPVDGIISILPVGILEKSDEMDFLIKAQEGRKIGYRGIDLCLHTVINTNISHNLPNTRKMQRTYSDKEPSLRESSTLNKSHFFPPPGVFIVDNEDPGFETTNTPTNSLRLSDYFTGEDQQKYKSLHKALNSKDKWITFIDNRLYGTTINSGAGKKSGKGDTFATWKVVLPKEGIYEISAFIPSITFGIYASGEYNKTFTKSANKPVKDNEKPFYHFTVRHTSGEAQLNIKLSEKLEKGWISLGEYMLQAGENQVSLSDRGMPDNIIVADAIRWTLNE